MAKKQSVPGQISSVLFIIQKDFESKLKKLFNKVLLA